jgi:hypothetical protein
VTDTRVVVVTKREREVLVLQVPTYKLIVEQKGPRGPTGDPGVDGSARSTGRSSPRP